MRVLLHSPAVASFFSMPANQRENNWSCRKGRPHLTLFIPNYFMHLISGISVTLCLYFLAPARVANKTSTRDQLMVQPEPPASVNSGFWSRSWRCRTTIRFRVGIFTIYNPMEQTTGCMCSGFWSSKGFLGKLPVFQMQAVSVIHGQEIVSVPLSGWKGRPSGRSAWHDHYPITAVY